VFFVQSLRDGLIARGIPVGGDDVDVDDLAGEPAMAYARRIL